MSTPHNGGMFCGPCYTCKCEMWLPKELHAAAQRGRGKISFFCAYGHGQVFSEGESDLAKMRRERDRLAQQIAERDDEIKRQKEQTDFALRQIGQLKTAATKARKRAIAGVCPCCHRSFTELRRHMANKHPEFKAEEVA